MKRRIWAVIFGISLLAATGVAEAAVCTSVSTGRWDQAVRWDCGHVPVAADTVVIAHNNVQMRNNYTVAGLTINASAVLDDNGKRLTVTGNVVNNGTFGLNGGGGRLIMNTAGTTISGSGTIDDARLQIDANSVTLAAGSTLNFINGGNIRVGSNAAGTLVVDGSITTVGLTNGSRLIRVDKNFPSNVVINGVIDALNAYIQIQQDGTIQNNGAVSIAYLDGNGDTNVTWTQGVNSTLSLSQPTQGWNNGTFTASATGNTVNFDGTATPFDPATYYNIAGVGVTCPLPPTITVLNSSPCPVTVLSINSAGANPTNAASVSWLVTFSTSVTGVAAGNFSLVNTGLGGTPAITGVSGSGTAWTVTASTGTGTGTLGLDMANNTGVTPALTNLPFTGQVYSVRPPAPVTYYHDTTNGVNIGFDGLTNVQSGTNVTIPPIITASLITANTCTGNARSNNHPTGLYTHSRWYLNADYTVATNIGANPGGSASLRGGAVTDTVAVSLYDYDPVTGAKVLIGSSPAITLTGGATTTTYPYTITSSLYTVPAGHRLMLEYAFNQAVVTYRARVYCSAVASFINVTESVATAAVTSIVRADPSPSSAATVSWTVTFDQSVTGVDDTAFGLAASGVSGAFITGVTGSGTTWTVTANTGIGAGTLGLNQTGPGAVVPTLSGTFTGEVYSITATPALAEYRMDEASWNGTANEVADSSGSGNHAQAFNSASTDIASPALTGSPGTCRYGVLDNGTTITKGYVQTPLGNLTSDFTVAAWIRTTNNTFSGQRILIDDQSNSGGYGISLGDGGAGRIRFFSRGIAPVILDSTYTIANNTWYFVAAVADITNKKRTIYVFDTAGALLSSTTEAAWTGGAWGTDAGPVSIGAETNASGEPPANIHFRGNLDEVRVYQKVLDQNALAAIAAQRHVCPVSVPNHIRLEHDGTAISCSAETVTVKACADATCSTLYAGAVSGDVTAGSNSVPFSITAGSGQTTVNIHLPSDSALADPQTVRLGTSAVSPVPADGGSPYCNGDVNNTTACDMSVYKAGFLFDVPHLTSGTASGTVNVSAVRSSDSSTCVPLFQNVSRTVAFWGEYQNPASGTQPLQVNGSNIETTATPAYTSTYALAFGVAGVATLTSVQYDDAGLMQLNARYVGSTANTPPDGGMVVLGSDTFAVKPDHFDLSGIQQTAVPNLVNPGAANAAGAKFVKAGEAFTVTVTAKNALGGTTANYGQETAAESVKLTSALVAGLGLTNNPPVDGSFGAFSNGVATGTAFTWNEAGIITLTPSVADADYLGAGDVTGTASGNVGRFYPDHLVLTAWDIANRDGLTCVPASTFTYMGEPMLLTLTVVAQNVANGLTQNYAGSFAKLDGATAGKWTALGSNDSIGLGAVDGTTALSGRLAIDGTPTGIWTTGTGTLSAGVVLNRDVSADGAFENLNLGIAPQDVDGVTLLPGELDLDADLNASSERKQVATTKVRYGRVRLNNAHGSELLALPVPLKVEYYDSASSGFVTNPDDSCTGFVIGDVALGNPTGTMTVLATTPSFVNNPVATGLSTVKLSKPGSGKYGSVDVTLTVPAWLQYAWGSGSNPTARATFGVYKGANEFIYLRETY